MVQSQQQKHLSISKQTKSKKISYTLLLTKDTFQCLFFGGKVKKYFGTDGIRGVVNATLTPKLAFDCGRVLGMQKQKAKVLVGKDTRISGDMLICAFVSGLMSQSVSVDILGLSTTPMVAYLTKSGYDFGVMITASHNSFEFNGIKIFDCNGNKLSSKQEKEIEKMLACVDTLKYAQPNNVGNVKLVENIKDKYVLHIQDKILQNKYNIKVCFDLANGGTIAVGKKIFSKCFFEDIVFINTNDDGFLINKNCGATSLDNLKTFVVSNGFDIGFAYDGDGDRIAIVDGCGNVFDGDDVLFLLAKYYDEKKLFTKRVVVGTQMTNFGLEHSLKKLNIKLKRVEVGDKNIKEEMQKYNYVLGGESSGHIIEKESCLGDGILVTISVLNALSYFRKPFKKIVSGCEKFCQIITNLKIEEKHKVSILKNKKLHHTIEKYENLLEDKGRVFVRLSGTEPVLRVLVEGINEKMTQNVSKKLSNEIQKILGID